MDNTPTTETYFQDIKFITLNVRGLGVASKRQEIIQEISKFKYDVLFMQEIYCTMQVIFISWVVEFKAQWGLSLSPSSSRAGTAIFVRDTTNFLIENIQQCTPDAGYTVALDISKKKMFYRIISVYFPSHIPTPLEPLIDWLSFMFNTKRRVIMGGDYNCVLNISLDYKNRTFRQKNCVNALETLCQNGNLIDPYRELYPQLMEYTHKGSVNPKGLYPSARLDRFYISSALLSCVKSVDIKPCVLSDHDYVISTIKTQSKVAALRGPGYWKLNVSILDNVDIAEVMENLWHQELDILLDLDGAWWEYCKTRFKNTLIILSKKIHSQRNDEKYKLKNEVMLYRKMQTASFQPRLFFHLIYLKGHRFKELIECDWPGAMIRSRVQETEEGEKSTRFFIQKEMKRNSKKRNLLLGN